MTVSAFPESVTALHSLASVNLGTGKVSIFDLSQIASESQPAGFGTIVGDSITDEEGSTNQGLTISLQRGLETQVKLS